MGDIRDKAKEMLKAVPEPPAQINSDGATAGTYTKLTHGLTHKSMTDNWATGGIKTGCNEFVAWYCFGLGSKVNLGRFDLETYLPTINKGNTWVKSTQDVRPKYGDICRHTAFHVGISLDFNGDKWNHVDAGQGGPKAGHDILMRTYGDKPYNYKNLQGWVDLDLFFAVASRPLPAGVLGWWKVSWRGTDYFYSIDKNNKAQWSRNPPQSTQLPMVLANDTGTVSLDDQNVLTIEWGNSGTIEKYNVQPAPNDSQMKGKWNDSEPISATKM